MTMRGNSKLLFAGFREPPVGARRYTRRGAELSQE